MTLPNFLGIGAQRAGTSWLFKMLSKHPDVFLPRMKEFHFFDEKPDFSKYTGLGNPGQRPYFDLNSPLHWKWYKSQFKEAGSSRAIGEITPFYATLSEQRVSLMAERLPDLKIIYIIRNPVMRAWSGFRLFWFLEAKHAECHLDEESLKNTIMYPAKLIHGNFQRNTSTYEKFIKQDRILFLFYDDIVDKPREVMNQVYSFLEVEPLQLPSEMMSQRVNKASEFQMPASIEMLLTEYYSNQISFIKVKFGRTLQY